MSGLPKPQIVCLLDVLGFENRLRSLGIDGMATKYERLIEFVKAQTGGLDVVPTPDGNVAVGWLVIGNTYFSDSLLFWTDYSKMALPSFTNCIAQAVCFGLEVGLPLRGSLAVGKSILDKDAGIFLGEPLIEVARGERTQHWIGASFGPSFSGPEFSGGFHLDTVLPYKSHYKDSSSAHATGIVVDWPRAWRETRKTDPTQAVQTLSDHDHIEYYNRTQAFIAFSAENHDWFKTGKHLGYG